MEKRPKSGRRAETVAICGLRPASGKTGRLGGKEEAALRHKYHSHPSSTNPHHHPPAHEYHSHKYKKYQTSIRSITQISQPQVSQPQVSHKYHSRRPFNPHTSITAISRYKYYHSKVCELTTCITSQVPLHVIILPCIARGRIQK